MAKRKGVEIAGEMPTVEDVTGAGEDGDGSGARVTRKLVEEMVPFLRDTRPEIRQAAAATAVTASATSEGVRLLHECGAVKWLCRISGDVGTIAADAVSALVNVSAEDTSVVALEDMCKAGIVNRMMETVSSKECSPRLRDLSLQLLANVTRLQMGAEKMAQVGVAGGTREGQHVRSVVRWLAANHAKEGVEYPEVVGSDRAEARVVDRRLALVDQTDPEGEGGRARSPAGADGRGVLDEWQHAANVLCNAARIPEGRKALKYAGPGGLETLLPELKSPNPLRRWGVAGCVRNCCFEEEHHPWLLHELRVVPHLLVRLSDPELDEYDFDEKVVLDPRVWRVEDGAVPRRREPVQAIKRDIVEALLQLCATRESRESLRKMGVYFVIRELDKAEPEGEISQVCYNLVNFLQREEQDKESRVAYLKGLEDGKEDLQHHDADAARRSSTGKLEALETSSANPPTAEVEQEIASAQGSRGTTAERVTYLRGKSPSETSEAEHGSGDRGKALGGRGRGGSLEEETVGADGADAVTAMLSSFDDSDGEEA